MSRIRSSAGSSAAANEEFPFWRNSTAVCCRPPDIRSSAHEADVQVPEAIPNSACKDRYTARFFRRTTSSPAARAWLDVLHLPSGQAAPVPHACSAWLSPDPPAVSVVWCDRRIDDEASRLPQFPGGSRSGIGRSSVPDPVIVPGVHSSLLL
ncbi:hypothetical protein D3C73_1239900 [compost metagenome]